MAVRAFKIDDDVAAVLRAAHVTGNQLVLAEQYPPKLYQRTAKVLKALEIRWEQRKAAHVADRPIKPILDEALSAGEATRNPDAFYRTPPEITERMVSVAGIGPGMYILEPSAGDGAIVEEIARQSFDMFVIAIESDPTRAAKIPKTGTVAVAVADFLDVTSGPIGDGGYLLSEFAECKYDRVIMNPPFASPGEPHAYFYHVMHAWEFLKLGGRLVAVCPIGFTFATRPAILPAFKDFVNEFGVWEELPDDAFKSSGTGVKTCLVILDK